MRNNSRLITARRIALALIALLLSVPTLAPANSAVGDETSTLSEKESWQADYRRLLSDAALLKRNATAARENYAQARRRNYPRGAAREQFMIDEDNAKKELVEVEAELDKFRRDARHRGVLPGWFYEVEDDPIEAPQPAAPSAEDVQDREGRNPLYLDDE
jgi:hypothetical protein